MKVLIAEDNDDLRNLLQLVLGARGFTVTVAMNGAEAIEILSRETPHAVISDFSMPLADGLDVCLARRRDVRLSRLPVIMLTALDVDVHSRLAEALALPDVTLMRKPPDFDVLARVLRSLAGAPMEATGS